MNNYDYPEGADDGSAPWNEYEIPREIIISQTLSKESVVPVWNTYDLENVDWEELYNREHYTPIKLIEILKQILEGSVNLGTMSPNRRRILIRECSEWIDDETEVFLNE